MRTPIAARAAAPAAALGVLLSACTSSTSGDGTSSVSPPLPSSIASTSSAPPPTSAPASVSSAPPSTPTPPPSSPAELALARMSEAQRVGQLLMVDCPTSGPTSATTIAVRQYHVGSVILDRTSFAGSSTIRGVTAQVQALAPRRVGLFVATDQEGGLVQRLQGPGFTRIPSAVEQGQLAPSTLRAQTRHWAAELHLAGVNVDLAPVLDVVPPGGAPNPPIGDLDREYGSTPAQVSSHGVAVAAGLASVRVAATVKHFPGLGRVTGNTDTTPGVTDSVTTRTDPYLAPFRAAIRAGVPFVMMSTAIYSRIDPGTPAAFSRTIVSGLLRHDLGFDGVVVSDDLGGAAQVSDVGIGDRAVRFVAAGGDMVLTVDANQAGAMTAALLARAQRDPAFKRLVDRAALRVLRAKERFGLLN